MHSPLTPDFYVSEDIFARERDRIFRRLWIFAGLKQLLKEPDAFLTRAIGGMPIVIQNFDGRLHAFENQCRHRQMPLQFEEYGRRRLACRYHGWVYGADGLPCSIPERNELYRLSDAQCSNLGLKEFALAAIGNFLFINLSERPIGIEEQFRPQFLAKLSDISTQFDDELIHTRIGTHYNWKFNVENVMDFNHIRYLHPRTFLPLMGESKDITAQIPVPALDEADLSNAKLNGLSYASETPFTIKPRPWHEKVRRYGTADVYYSFFVYPNVNFISVGGLVFLIQQFDPVSPSRTEVVFTLMTARKTTHIPAHPAVLWGQLQGQKMVLDEDVRLLERLQAGLHDGSQRAFHGAYERHLIKVARVYRELLGLP